MKTELKLWKYKHYKWGLYEVLWVARHSETLEELVVYRALYNSIEFWNNSLWVRPKSMFIENVVIDWMERPRFEYLGE
jgi:hypothetical protein